jgi:hypothetical protein
LGRRNLNRLRHLCPHSDTVWDSGEAQGEKPSVGRILYLTYDELLPKLDEFWDIFSKDAVLKGSFDRYAEATRGKRGTSEVDAEFLREIEGWRDELARNIAIRNEDLSVDDLNFAVQTTIDRIIFLRIAEGRGAEPYGSLLALVNDADIYERLRCAQRPKRGDISSASDLYGMAEFLYMVGSPRGSSPRRITERSQTPRRSPALLR